MKETYFIHESSFVDFPDVTIGEGTKIWHFSHICEGAVIGENCVIGQNVYIGKDVHIGDNVKIQNNVSVYSGVTIEDNVFMGPSVVFTNVINPRSTVNRKKEFKKTIVREGSSIGANSTVICGNNIGKCSFVGAGSVVTKDTPDHAICYGNPAKRKGWMCECGEKLTRMIRRQWHCNLCDIKYKYNWYKLYKMEKKCISLH